MADKFETLADLRDNKDKFKCMAQDISQQWERQKEREKNKRKMLDQNRFGIDLDAQDGGRMFGERRAPAMGHERTHSGEARMSSFRSPIQDMQSSDKKRSNVGMLQDLDVDSEISPFKEELKSPSQSEMFVSPRKLIEGQKVDEKQRRRKKIELRKVRQEYKQTTQKCQTMIKKQMKDAKKPSDVVYYYFMLQNAMRFNKPF